MHLWGSQELVRPAAQASQKKLCGLDKGLVATECLPMQLQHSPYDRPDDVLDEEHDARPDTPKR